MSQDVLGPEYYTRPGAALHGYVVDVPAGPCVMVDDALTAAVPMCSKVLDGQVTDRYAASLPGECEEVRVLTVENRSPGSEESVTIRSDDLVVLADTESMPAWREPVRLVRLDGPVVRDDGAAVIASWDNYRTLGRRFRAAPKDGGIAAHPSGGRCRASRRDV